MKKLITTILALMLSIGVWANGATPTVIAAWNYTTANFTAGLANDFPATSGRIAGTSLQFFYADGSYAGSTDPVRAPLRNGERMINAEGITAAGWLPSSITTTDVAVDVEESAGWVITLNTTGFEDITLSAEQRSANNGPGFFQLAWRVGTTGAWTVVPGFEVTRSQLPSADTWVQTINNVELPAEIEDQDEVQIRVWISNSERRSGGLLLQDGGNTSINNIVFSGIGDAISQPTELVITDVSHSPTPVTEEDAVTVTATVTYTTSAIDEVFIRWNDGVAYTDTEMTTAGDNVWTGTIPAQAVGTEVTFAVIAINVLDERTESDLYGFTVVSSTVISAWNYTVASTNPDWPATGGAVTAGTSLEFFYAMTPGRATLGAGNLLINVPNSGAGGWFPREANNSTVPSEPITANASAGWVITLDTRGFEDITFSASQASTGGGPADFALAYRIGTTGAWIPFGEMRNTRASVGTGVNDPLVPTFVDVALPAEMNNQAVVQLRVFIATAINRGGTALVANNGNHSINDIVFRGVGAPPVITELTISNVGFTPLAPTQNDDVTVTATVTEATSAIRTVWIDWTLDGDLQPEIDMTEGADNVWSGTIPAQAIGAEVVFVVVAENELYDEYLSGEYRFTVIDDGNIRGTIGDLTWVVYDDVLTISVTADAPATAGMEDFYIPDGEGNAGLSPAPWTVHRALFSSVVIEERVTSIGEEAFRGIREITTLTLGEDLVTIGANAFRGLTQLTSVTIPNSVTYIGGEAFRGLSVAATHADASTLATVTLGTGLITIGSGAFRQLPLLTSIEIPNSVTTFEDDVFRETSLTIDVLPVRFTAVPEGMFRGTLATTVTIPNHIDSIAESAFREMPNLTSITLGTGLEIIGISAFRQNPLLTYAVIPDNVTTVLVDAFGQNPTLATVTIGSGVTNIADRAFGRNPQLSTVITLSPVPPTAHERAFRENLPAGACLIVPAGAVEAYEAATGWSAFTCIREYSTYLLITNVDHTPTVPTYEQDIVVSATVTALDGVEVYTVYLEWTLEGNAQAAIRMATEGNNLWTATISAQAAGAAITYRIVATNDSDETTKSAWYDFMVYISTELIISNVSHSPAAPTADDAVTVTATVEYTVSAVQSVVIEWRRGELVLSPQTPIAMTRGENNVWSGVIPQSNAGLRVEYTIVATNALNEVTRSSAVEFTVAGGTNIAVLAENNAISVFPNPVVDVLTVTVADFAPGMTFNLFDVNGRMVQTGAISSETTTIDMTNLRAGTYVLTIVQNGTQVATFRVVKQ